MNKAQKIMKKKAFIKAEMDKVLPKFERTGTLGKGAERCDFCFRKV